MATKLKHTFNNPASYHFFDLYEKWDFLSQRYRKSVCHCLPSKPLHTFAPKELTERFVKRINEGEIGEKQADGSFRFFVQEHYLQTHSPDENGQVFSRALFPVKGPSFILTSGQHAYGLVIFFLNSGDTSFAAFARRNTTIVNKESGLRILKTNLVKELQTAEDEKKA